ncbi:hypothetical protein [Pinirhizobacter sp.]|jgi:hypothetical protein|uniref:hypothetical protein n=1 Tax=Pinirhizobacter sp. TaxID=2950432 RepID=UPI002F41DD15
MAPQTFPDVPFFVLFGMVIMWFVMIKLLFNRLEAAHPEKYAAMGRPSLFLRNSVASSWATMRFLVTREHRTLNDSYLSRLSDAMLVFFAIYLLLFFGMVFFVSRVHAS